MPHPSNLARDSEIVQLAKAGIQLVRIAERFSLTGARISQIVAAADGKPRVRTAQPSHTPALRNPRGRPLSPQQTQITACVARGLLNKQIAWELRITEGTVKSHLGEIFQRLGLRSRLELALWWQQEQQKQGSALGDYVLGQML